MAIGRVGRDDGVVPIYRTLREDSAMDGAKMRALFRPRSGNTIGNPANTLSFTRALHRRIPRPQSRPRGCSSSLSWFYFQCRRFTQYVL